MDYKHILVAVDLSKSSDKIIKKAVEIAKVNQAKISFVFVELQYPLINTDFNYSGYALATFESDIALSKAHQKALQALADNTDYDIDNCLYLTGDVSNTLQHEVKELDADLMVCGHHHHGFWSGLLSSTSTIVNATTTDLFIVQV